MRLEVQPGGTLEATNSFSPFDAAELDTWDADFGSGGAVALPEEQFGTADVPRLAVAVGKAGYIYLLDRDDLGGIATGPGSSDRVVQRLGPYGGVWSRPGVEPGDGGSLYLPTEIDEVPRSRGSGGLALPRGGGSGSRAARTRSARPRPGR